MSSRRWFALVLVIAIAIGVGAWINANLEGLVGWAVALFGGLLLFFAAYRIMR